MNALASQELITNGIIDFGSSVLVILGAVVLVGIAYLIYKFGWNILRLTAKFDTTGYVLSEPFENGKRYWVKSRYYKKWNDNVDIYRDFKGRYVDPW